MDAQLAERAFQLAWQHYDNIGQVSVSGKKTELSFPAQCVIEKYAFCHVEYCGGSDLFDTFSPFYKAWLFWRTTPVHYFRSYFYTREF
ncbi:hypothetical protein IPH25_01780 [bacterium]|nr:MAG: hypothetical protein IPG37_03910 [bacterium]QQR62155.1 MAG: hypothetical protein IPH25_01780 [bacterium]QQR63288.1 MAG: hypothetical protein IPH67_02330 [bacterium]